MCQISSVEGEVVGMTVGVAERSTVLLVTDDIGSMLTGGYVLLRVCLKVGGIVSMTSGVGVPGGGIVCTALGVGVPGGGIVCTTLGVRVPGGGIVCTTLGVPEGVKILSLVAEVTEGVGCSVCFVHAWGERMKRESRFMYIHCTSLRLSLGTSLLTLCKRL